MSLFPGCFLLHVEIILFYFRYVVFPGLEVSVGKIKTAVHQDLCINSREDPLPYLVTCPSLGRSLLLGQWGGGQWLPRPTLKVLNDIISVTTTLLCWCSTIAVLCNTQMNGYSWIPIKFLLGKEAAGWIWSAGHNVLTPTLVIYCCFVKL